MYTQNATRAHYFISRPKGLLCKVLAQKLVNGHLSRDFPEMGIPFTDLRRGGSVKGWKARDILSQEVISRRLSWRWTTGSATLLFHRLAQHAIAIETMPNSLIITAAGTPKND